MEKKSPNLDNVVYRDGIKSTGEWRLHLLRSDYIAVCSRFYTWVLSINRYSYAPSVRSVYELLL